MDFDSGRAAVVAAGPADAVVARWPGIVCVAQSADPAALARLLDLCEEVAAEPGPAAGRTLARRLAMWLSGGDAGDLRFGTLAVAGDQWATFLTGPVELVVPEQDVALSGTQSAAWTDRLLPVPEGPVALTLAGVALPPDKVGGVHDLRLGVVPGSGVVLVPDGAPPATDDRPSRAVPAVPALDDGWLPVAAPFAPPAAPFAEARHRPPAHGAPAYEPPAPLPDAYPLDEPAHVGAHEVPEWDEVPAPEPVADAGDGAHAADSADTAAGSASDEGWPLGFPDEDERPRPAEADPSADGADEEQVPLPVGAPAEPGVEHGAERFAPVPQEVAAGGVESRPVFDPAPDFAPDAVAPEDDAPHDLAEAATTVAPPLAPSFPPPLPSSSGPPSGPLSPSLPSPGPHGGPRPAPIGAPGPEAPGPPGEATALAGAVAPARSQPAPPPRRAERIFGVDPGEPQRPPLAAGAPVGAPVDTQVDDKATRVFEQQQPRAQGHLCARGHLNDPRSHFCVLCGIRMNERTGVLVVGARPPLGLLVFDDGSTYTVDAEYLVGRMPEADQRVRSGVLRAIIIEDRSGSVSRVHAEVRVNGWDVMLVDSGSRNGTYVSAPGEPGWTPLPPHQTQRLVPGTKVRLGARTFVFESPSGVR